MNKYLKIIILSVNIIFLMLFFLYNPKLKANEVRDIKVLNSKLYENDLVYSTNENDSVSEMSNGHSSLVEFKLSGTFTQESTYRNYKAFGLEDNPSFSFSYDGKLLDNSVLENWHLRISEETKIEDINLEASIHKGALIIMKSYDGVSFELATNPILNFLESNPEGYENFYTPSGNDISRGTFYKIILAYKSGHRTKKPLIGKDKYEDKYSVEETTFFLTEDTAKISIHNLSVTEEDLMFDDYSVELLKRGETLVDGSTTITGFSIDKLGVDNLVFVKKNDEEELLVEDGDEFTEPGLYNIKVLSKLGTENNTKIYIFNSDDFGYDNYFGENIISGNRVFSFGDIPAYARGTKLKFENISEFTPMLFGTVRNITTNELVYETIKTREEVLINLSLGEYEVILYNGDTNLSGSFYKYTFRFEVVDKDSSPFYNYYNLINANRLQDLDTKHYEVAYQTTAGGYIYVVFSLDSYNEAFQYAYEIEKRFLEEKSEEGAYYKSRENPNVKKYYYDLIELTSVMNYYAKLNVESNYFNPLDKFTYRTLENESLDDLESMSITESIKVFPSIEEKLKMINSDKLFLNNFQFIQVGNYDVETVTAYSHKNKRTYEINFKEEVSRQLPVTSLYTITETNIYGDKVSYDAYVINDSQTIVNATVSINGVISEESYSSSNVLENKIYIKADKFTINSLINNYDDLAFVSIKAPTVYSFKLVSLNSELEGLELYKAGRYNLLFIDRIGNSYEIELDITGNSRYSGLNTSTQTYSELFNKVYINEVSLVEELIVDVSLLEKEINRDIDKNKYTIQSYNRYYNSLMAALKIYNNSLASQLEIDQAIDNLLEQYNLLVPSQDKSSLQRALLEFESLNKGLYTTSSYDEYYNVYIIAKDAYLTLDLTISEMNDYINDLNNAKNNLVLRGNKDSLFNLLNKISSLDVTLYTPRSIQNLNESYILSKEVFNNLDATLEEINLSYSNLNLAFLSLVYLADFSAIDQYIELIQKLNKDNYTDNSILLLNNAYNEALQVANDRNSPQTLVDSKLDNLVRAYNFLDIVGDNTNLVNKIKELEEVKLYLLSNKSYIAIKEIYNEANLLLSKKSSQNDYDQMVIEILNVIDNVELNENRVNLYEKLMEIEDYTSLSSNKQQQYVESYNKLMNLDLTDEEIMETLSDYEIVINSEDNEHNDNNEEEDDTSDIIIGLIMIIFIIGVVGYLIYLWLR